MATFYLMHEGFPKAHNRLLQIRVLKVFEISTAIINQALTVSIYQGLLRLFQAPFQNSAIAQFSKHKTDLQNSTCAANLKKVVRNLFTICELATTFFVPLLEDINFLSS